MKQSAEGLGLVVETGFRPGQGDDIGTNHDSHDGQCRHGDKQAPGAARHGEGLTSGATSAPKAATWSHSSVAVRDGKRTCT